MSHPETDDAVSNIVNLLIERTQTHHEDVDRAVRWAKTLGIASSTVNEAAEVLKERQQANLSIVDSVVSAEARTNRWYYGPVPDKQWGKYRAKWVASGKPGLAYLDDSTTRITGLLADPKQLGKRKGIVMGNVQSGKTGNFAGVIAKAADAGYKVVIVMAGIYNNLRSQTQARLEHDVFGLEWELRTDDMNDLGGIRQPARAFKTTQMTALVVKKNPKRLENLRDALRGLPEQHRNKLPILIIDDEADQATPNSPTQRVEVTTINRLMREIWAEVKVGSYVAYTATPFANVLMNVDDTEELFPSDFITSLRPGETYFGAERVFGVAEGVTDEGVQDYADGLDMVRTVPDEDVAALKPPSNSDERAGWPAPMVGSLAEALRWFITATVVRRLRGDTDHSSMLVHTTHYAGPHMVMQQRIDAWLAKEMQAPDLSTYEQLWDREKDRVDLGTHLYQPPWTDIQAEIRNVLSVARTIVDNGLSKDRLDYTQAPGQTVIAVGGGTLSRGLTLVGLVVSYFTRTTNTYDTLMQMGRWFGYRDGYEDLPRIWVSKGLDKDYAFLARVERDLRDEIESIEETEMTPEQVGVRVRHHPGRLEITSVSRMKNAQLVQVTLSGTMRQSFMLDGSTEVQQHNTEAVRNLLAGGVHPSRNGRLEATGVTSDRVSRFLMEFTVHRNQHSLQSQEQKEAMASWLSQFGGRAEWTVVVSNNTAPDARGRLGVCTVGGHEVVRVNRAPLKDSSLQELNFKAVMSPSDWIADISPRAFAGSVPTTGAQRRRARREHAHGKGLVVIYPISPDSAPQNDSKSRTTMPAEVTDTVWAFAIVFPTIEDAKGTEGTFVSVRPNPLAVVEEYVDEHIPDTEGDGEGLEEDDE